MRDCPYLSTGLPTLQHSHAPTTHSENIFFTFCPWNTFSIFLGNGRNFSIAGNDATRRILTKYQIFQDFYLSHQSGSIHFKYLNVISWTTWNEEKFRAIKKIETFLSTTRASSISPVVLTHFLTVNLWLVAAKSCRYNACLWPMAVWKRSIIKHWQISYLQTMDDKNFLKIVNNDLHFF